jgi:hypothetical protein
MGCLMAEVFLSREGRIPTKKDWKKEHRRSEPSVARECHDIVQLIGWAYLSGGLGPQWDIVGEAGEPQVCCQNFQ